MTIVKAMTNAKGYGRALQAPIPKDDYQRLRRGFYARSTHEVAKELLGKLLVRQWRGRQLAARICEVESYVGENDRACHAAPRKRTAFSRGRRGHTPRTEVMYGQAGHAYVYLVYGMHHCLNIVTELTGFPAAVLIRGAVLVRYPGLRVQNTETRLLQGPGKLCRALHITRAQNTEDLVTSRRLFVADDGVQVAPADIMSSPRIGVDYAGDDAKLPWRYVASW